MKLTWLALAALLAPSFLLVALNYLLYRPGLPPAAQASLNAYLSVHNRTANPPESVLSVLHASQPGAFAPAMSRASYGDNFYFGTTYGTRGVEGSPTNRPAPFPVNDLWCATVGGGRTPRTVLLAQHEDLYVAAWVVHEPASAAVAGELCR